MGSLTFECFDLEQTVRSIAAATGVSGWNFGIPYSPSRCQLNPLKVGVSGAKLAEVNDGKSIRRINERCPTSRSCA